jgi:hypothetical protein
MVGKVGGKETNLRQLLRKLRVECLVLIQEVEVALQERVELEGQ